MSFIEMTGKSLARIINDNELSADDLATARTRFAGVIRISCPQVPAPTPSIGSSVSASSTNDRKPVGCQ